MINYTTTARDKSSRINREKRNILLIGHGTKNEKAKVIINPINIENAKKYMVIVNCTVRTNMQEK